MSIHSTVEAKNSLSALIDRALAGEEVVITRHGQPVVVLQPIRQASHPAPAANDGHRATPTDWAWIWARRDARGPVPAEDAATAVRRMRDEGP